MENCRCARNKTIGQTVLRQTHLYVFWVEVLGWSVSKLSGTPIPEDALILTHSQLLKSASTSDNGKWGGVQMTILGYSEQNRTYLSIFYDVSCLICLYVPVYYITMKSWDILTKTPSGKRLHNDGTSPFVMGKLTTSMAIFHMLVITRGYSPSNSMKLSCSYRFPMVFLWFSYGFPWFSHRSNWSHWFQRVQPFSAASASVPGAGGHVAKAANDAAAAPGALLERVEKTIWYWLIIDGSIGILW